MWRWILFDSKIHKALVLLVNSWWLERNPIWLWVFIPPEVLAIFSHVFLSVHLNISLLFCSLPLPAPPPPFSPPSLLLAHKNSSHTGYTGEMLENISPLWSFSARSMMHPWLFFIPFSYSICKIWHHIKLFKREIRLLSTCPCMCLHLEVRVGVCVSRISMHTCLWVVLCYSVCVCLIFVRCVLPSDSVSSRL